MEMDTHGATQRVRKLCAILGALACFAAGPAAGQGTIEIAAGMHRIEAEVAADFDTRMQGLMHRRQMPAQRGMLFVFPNAEKHCMWMRNTFIPLSVAFINDDGTIANIEDMQPHTESSHCAARPVRYALEMNKGWFAQRGIKPGAKVFGLDRAPRPR